LNYRRFFQSPPLRAFFIPVKIVSIQNFLSGFSEMHFYAGYDKLQLFTYLSLNGADFK